MKLNTTRIGRLMWRWYNYYCNVLGGRRRNPENLCRLLRVCLFWAPLRWFFIKGERNYSTPASYTMCGIMIIIFGGGVMKAIWEDWQDVAVMLLTLLCVFGGIIEFFRVFLWAQEHYQRTGHYRIGNSGFMCPIIEEEAVLPEEDYSDSNDD